MSGAYDFAGERGACADIEPWESGPSKQDAEELEREWRADMKRLAERGQG